MALALVIVAVAGVMLGIRTSFDPAVGPGRLIYPTVDSASLNGSGHQLLVDPPQKTFSMIITHREHPGA